MVVSCYRQERFLARTVAALERALEGRDWQGVLEFALPPGEALPPRGGRWRVLVSHDAAAGRTTRPLTPGGGRMAGFRACGGEWVLFVDSDMELDRAWVDAAVATAEREPGLGGLGGRIEEWFVDGSGERPGKRDLYGTGDTDHPVDYFGNVAFYRRAALEAVGGYDERLCSDEDFELGMRMRWRGLELRALGLRAGRHWSAPRPSFPELGRRWRTGLFYGQGQVLRLYLGRRGFGTLLHRQGLYVLATGMWGLGLLALAAWLLTGDARPFAGWLVAPLGALALMTAKKRSPRLALHSLLSWTMLGLGMVAGLFRPLPAGVSGPRPAGEGAPC